MSDIKYNGYYEDCEFIKHGETKIYKDGILQSSRMFNHGVRVTHGTRVNSTYGIDLYNSDKTISYIVNGKLIFGERLEYEHPTKYKYNII